jgi:GSH-dependent disulfide-bond oxidoreductase
MTQRPIDVFYWPTPNGWKVTIALEEMGLPYTLVPVNIAAGDQFKPDFLKISPNNRMPAITDPDGPGGEPISVFESGAILQYLGRKTGQFYPADERGRAEVDQWLFWQMGGLGPMAGQAHHFRQYAPAMLDDPKLTEYGAERYTKEVNRLYGVMDRRLADRDYLAGAYSIADMACWPWIVPWQMQGQELDDFKNLRAWFERMRLRAPVQAGFKAGEELRKGGLGEKNDEAEKARKILFGQTSRN